MIHTLSHFTNPLKADIKNEAILQELIWYNPELAVPRITIIDKNGQVQYNEEAKFSSIHNHVQEAYHALTPPPVKPKNVATRANFTGLIDQTEPVRVTMPEAIDDQLAAQPVQS